MNIDKEFSISDAKIILEETIKSNKYNRSKGLSDKNVAVRFIGESGIGKSELAFDFAKENGYSFKYLNLSELTEESSMYGFPRETYKISSTEDVSNPDGTIYRKKVIKNIRVLQLDKYLNDKDTKWTLESKDSEMTYSIPQWVKELEKTDTSLLILDEFSRAQVYIMQAVMNLVLFGKFGNWELPRGTQIVLLDNPDSGDYNVTSLDEAQLTRFLNYKVKSNIDSWVKWASSKGIHEECINFLYKTPEAREATADKLTDIPSYRVWTMFFNRISHIKDLNDKNYFGEIQRAGVGSVGERMLNLFKIFIDNNLGSIPSLHEVFSPKVSTGQASKMLKDAIFVDGQVRNDIKGLLGLRLIGYCYNQKNLNADFLNKFDALAKEGVITVDVILRIFKDLNKSNPSISSKLIGSCPSISKILTDNIKI